MALIGSLRFPRFIVLQHKHNKRGQKDQKPWLYAEQEYTIRVSNKKRQIKASKASNKKRQELSSFISWKLHCLFETFKSKNRLI